MQEPAAIERAWPPDYYVETNRRLGLYKRFKADRNILYSKVYDYYRLNPVAWINDWCFTYDPRAKDPHPKLMPFVLFPRQEELVQFLFECYRDGENGLIEKSRDMGATWVCCAFTVWLWIFHSGTAIGWGSRLSDLVDELGNPDSIFEKMRIIISKLPKFMLPVGFEHKRHMPFMKILNPQTGANIAGETGDNIGRGGRSSIYFKDESAHYERPEKIEAALGDNTDVQIDFSSVNGTGNVFHRRRMAGQVWAPGTEMEKGRVRVFIMDWRDHPHKTEEWYEARRSKAEREGLMAMFAQEVDRDYSGSVVGVIIPQKYVKAAIDAHIKLGFEPSGIMRAMQDVADGGGDKNALVGGRGVVCQYADHWGGEAGEAAKIAVPKCVELEVTDLYYDSVGVGAGFKTQINTMKGLPSWPSHLNVYPWNAGANPMNPDRPSIPGDPKSPKNKDQYKNMKAQAWMSAYARFYKTYQAVTYGVEYPPEELVSIDSTIPRLHELCMELSQAVRKDNGEGKMIVDKGKPSPNLADAFIGWLFPCKKSSIFD